MPKDKLRRSGPVDTLPTAVGVLSRLAVDRAEKAEIDVGPLLKKAGLPATLKDDERIRVNARSQISFLNLLADALDDPWLGFHLARDMDLRELGPFYYMTASAQKLGDALEHAARYSSVVNEGVRMNVTRGTSGLTIDFDYVGLERHLDRHQMMFWMTCTLKEARVFTNRELVPTYVGLIQQNLTPTTEMERYFASAINFGAASDRISFDAQEAEMPVVTEDPYLNKFMVAYYEEIAASRQWRQNPLRTRVENAISPRLPHGTANVATIASDLGMSTRTLSRRLADEGLTFSSILDELRADLSEKYLQNGELSISQIAWLLGYTEVSSFAHAFQRWTGKSPTDARRAIKGATPAADAALGA
jgi:AraC-like DNA-binding protein